MDTLFFGEPVAFGTFDSSDIRTIRFTYNEIYHTPFELGNEDTDTSISISRDMKFIARKENVGHDENMYEIRIYNGHNILDLNFRVHTTCGTPIQIFLQFISKNPKLFSTLIIQSESFISPWMNHVTTFVSDRYIMPASIRQQNALSWISWFEEEIRWKKNLKKGQVHILCDEDCMNESDLANRPDYEIIISKYDDVSLFYKRKDYVE